MGKPFARANAMMALVAAAISQFAGNFAAQRQALDALGAYESRGHGRGFSTAQGNGSARVRRAATKARNVRRNRRMHRGG